MSHHTIGAVIVCGALGIIALAGIVGTFLDWVDEQIAAIAGGEDE